MQTIYYQDELNDEFAGDHIQAKTIDEAIGISGMDFWGSLPMYSGIESLRFPLPNAT